MPTRKLLLLFVVVVEALVLLSSRVAAHISVEDAIDFSVRKVQASRNCFLPSLLPGCDIDSCQQTICNINASCCDVGWSKECALDACKLCNVAANQNGLIDLKISITLDFFPSETIWQLQSINHGLVAKGGPYHNELTIFESVVVDLCPSDCYLFTILDLADNGICCIYGQGSYTLAFGDKIINRGGQFGAKETVHLGNCALPCQNDTMDLIIDIYTEVYTKDNYWEVRSVNDGLVLATGEPPEGYEAGTLVVLVPGLCPSDCYEISFFDLAGDAICCVRGFLIFGDTKIVLPEDLHSFQTLRFGNCSSPACTDLNISISITTDEVGSTTRWILHSFDDNWVVATGGGYPDESTTFESVVGLCSSRCYVFTIYDYWGNGICCLDGKGNYTLTSGDSIIAVGGAFSIHEKVQVGNCVPTDCVVANMSISITTDLSPHETTWRVRKLGENLVLAFGGPYDHELTTFEFHKIGLCSSDCYEFTISDLAGDGICCGKGEGSYSLTFGDTIAADGGIFAASETVLFGNCVCQNEPTKLTINSLQSPDCLANVTMWHLDKYNSDSSVQVEVSSGFFSNEQMTSESVVVGLCLTDCFEFWMGYDSSCAGKQNYTLTFGGTVISKDIGEWHFFGNCTCPMESTTLNVNIKTDLFPEETSWQLRSVDDNVVLATGGPYDLKSMTFQADVYGLCDSGCYVFTIIDKEGDGVCCVHGEGSYNLTFGTTYDDAYASIEKRGKFGSFEAVLFGNCACHNHYDTSDLKISITTDLFPQETTWNVRRLRDGWQLATGGPYYQSLMTFDYSMVGLCPSDCYEFTIVHKQGDGICCTHDEVSYNLTFAGTMIGRGEEFGSSETVLFGSCSQAACTDLDVSISIMTDLFPGETSWKVRSINNDLVLAMQGPYHNVSMTFDSTVVGLCPSDCYEFTIFDEISNGLCCDHGAGSYTFNIGETMIATGGKFGSSETVFFGNCSQTHCRDLDIGISITTDLFPNATSWEVRSIKNNSALAMLQQGPYDNVSTTFDYTVVGLCPSDCYEFTIFDENSNGLCCDHGAGSYTLTIGETMIVTGGEFGSSETVFFGSCFMSNCTDLDMSIRITTDDFPLDTTWQVQLFYDSMVLASGGPYFNAFTMFEHALVGLCSSDCYEFTIFDTLGNGICCEGGYSLIVGERIIEKRGNFGSSETVRFGNCSETS